MSMGRRAITCFDGQNKETIIWQATSDSEIVQARALFIEYAQSLDFSLCFQGFDSELAGLPGDYRPPEGRLLLAQYDAEIAGCGALHYLEAGICEMKRLYIRPQFRGKGLGRAVAMRLVSDARIVGYKKMRLDTVESQMVNAVALYHKLGFREIGPYRPNPIADAMYMELDL